MKNYWDDFVKAANALQTVAHESQEFRERERKRIAGLLLVIYVEERFTEVLRTEFADFRKVLGAPVDWGYGYGFREGGRLKELYDAYIQLIKHFTGRPV